MIFKQVAETDTSLASRAMQSDWSDLASHPFRGVQGGGTPCWGRPMGLVPSASTARTQLLDSNHRPRPSL